MVVTNYDTVAPHAGAWIETFDSVEWTGDKPVAPHAGAWIETQYDRLNKIRLMSRPMRARGLKHLLTHHGISVSCRAPCGRVD